MMLDHGLIALMATIVALGMGLVTLINTNAAIVLLIVSMLLSPEIPLGALSERAVVIRAEDLLLGVIFFSWLAKLAINKQMGLLRSTPLNVPIGLFTLSCFLSTGLGLLRGTVQHPVGSGFYLLKYVEYFMLYFMVANVTHERRQVELFLKALLLTAACVCLYAYWQMAAYGIHFRLTAPFEGIPEPNTLAGYFLIMMAVCVSLAVYGPSASWQLASLGLVLLMLPPFLFTYSRGGYVAFIAAYLVICWTTRKHRLVLWSVLVLGILLATTLLPHTVYERMASTFDPRGAVQVGHMRLAASPAQRILIWRYIFEQWKQHPLLGFGVTGVGFVDNQNALVLGEVGIIGMLFYVWVRWRLLAISHRAFRRLEDPLGQALSLGFFAALIGLLVHSLTGNIFIIIRIMEPFWLLAAIVTVLPRVLGPASAPTAP